MSDHATTPLSQLPSVGKMTLDNADVLAIVRRHEAIQFKSFTHETAWQVGSTIRTLFLENRGKAGTKPGDPGIVIHIVLWNGHTLFTSSLGSAPRVGPGAWSVGRKSVFNIRRSFGHQGMDRWKGQYCKTDEQVDFTYVSRVSPHFLHSIRKRRSRQDSHYPCPSALFHFSMRVIISFQGYAKSDCVLILCLFRMAGSTRSAESQGLPFPEFVPHGGG